jgi:hypothetical protein
MLVASVVLGFQLYNGIILPGKIIFRTTKLIWVIQANVTSIPETYYMNRQINPGHYSVLFPRSSCHIVSRTWARVSPKQVQITPKKRTSSNAACNANPNDELFFISVIV